jgi:GTPase Era involved in 16S rRNA processing
MPIDKNVLEMAKQECKGTASEEDVEWLQKPENRFTWCQALITALSDCDSQVAFHKNRIDLMAKDVELGMLAASEYFEEKQKFSDWVRKSMRYRNGVSQRLSEVRALLGNDPRIKHVEEIEKLTKAIIAHRRASIENQYAAEAHDYKLWATVIQD